MTSDALLAERLAGGLADMALNTTPAQRDTLLEYLRQLHKWNKVYNLTAIRDPLEMVGKHLLDSLSAVPFMLGDSVLDVGTGGGLPGIPIAIMRPDIAVTLLDSNQKKTRFLTHMQSHLQLDNVTVAPLRVEQFDPPAPFRTVTSRAFASLRTFVTQCNHLCRSDGEFVAMLGKAPEADDTASLNNRIIATVPISVPGVTGERHIARVRPQ